MKKKRQIITITMTNPQNLDPDTVMILSNLKYYRVIGQLSSTQFEVEELSWIGKIWVLIEAKLFI